MNKNFALIGCGGYVAPKHMKAITDTGNNLIAALDRNDSVGILDSFSYDTAFFTEFERFDRHAEKLRRRGEQDRIHYVSICSPNYLHDAHIRFALRIGADAICEKPLVLNPWNLDALQELENETGQTVYNILQLRLHPAILELKNKIETGNRQEKHKIDLSYITSRGRWYFVSWKGDVEKSGGVATNIGIHFFDMLLWIFGSLQHQEVHLSEANKMAGYIELEHAEVRWFLSVDSDDLPEEAKRKNSPTWRSITVDGEEVEFSGGFTDLHTKVYEGILAGQGHGIEAACPSLELVSDVRNMKVLSSNNSRVHPFVSRIKT